jgi:hypothetical protein
MLAVSAAEIFILNIILYILSSLVSAFTLHKNLLYSSNRRPPKGTFSRALIYSIVLYFAKLVDTYTPITETVTLLQIYGGQGKYFEPLIAEHLELVWICDHKLTYQYR